MFDRVVPADLGELHALLALAFGGPPRRPPSIHSWVAQAADGVYLVARHDDRIVASAGAIGFGPSAWVGGVAVHPDARGERLAERLTAAAIDALGPRETVSLLATDAGRRTYDRLGFEPEGAYRAFGPGPTTPPPPPPGGVRAATAADRAVILALDRAATGEDRAALLAPGLDGALVTSDLTGASVDLPFPVAHVVAATPAAGAALLGARIAQGRRLNVPVANAAALAALDGHDELPGTVRMRRGRPLDVREERIFGTATLFCA